MNEVNYNLEIGLKSNCSRKKFQGLQNTCRITQKQQVLQESVQLTNLNGSLHLNKAHSTIPSHRKSVMIAKPWNFYTSHGTGLNKHRDNNK